MDRGEKNVISMDSEDTRESDVIKKALFNKTSLPYSVPAGPSLPASQREIPIAREPGGFINSSLSFLSLRARSVQ